MYLSYLFSKINMTNAKTDFSTHYLYNINSGWNIATCEEQIRFKHSTEEMHILIKRHEKRY